jgi:hypothetical protein
MRLWCFLIGLEAEGWVVREVMEHHGSYSALCDMGRRRRRIFMDV